MVFALLCGFLLILCFFFPPGAEQADLTVTDILFEQSIYMSFPGLVFLNFSQRTMT